MSALATAVGKSFDDRFTVKINFPIEYFTIKLLMVTLEVHNLSTHSLISISQHAGEI